MENKQNNLTITDLYKENVIKIPLNCLKSKVILKQKYDMPFIFVKKFNTNKVLPFEFNKAISRTINLKTNEQK